MFINDIGAVVHGAGRVSLMAVHHGATMSRPFTTAKPYPLAHPADHGSHALLTDLLNVLLGVLGSLIAWLLLTKALRPRLVLGESLEQLIRLDGSVVYRVLYRNPRVRRVEDVHVTVRLVMRTNPTDAAP